MAQNPLYTSGSNSVFGRVRLFTDVEDITLDVWLTLENQGKDDQAADVLDKGTFLEHYIATLPLTVSPEEDGTVEQLFNDFADAVLTFVEEKVVFDRAKGRILVVKTD